MREDLKVLHTLYAKRAPCRFSYLAQIWPGAKDTVGQHSDKTGFLIVSSKLDGLPGSFMMIFWELKYFITHKRMAQ